MFTGVCVAVCTAVLTSCTKENEVINDVPAMEMRVALPPDTVTVTESKMILLYWHLYDAPQGSNFLFIRKCEKGWTKYGICAMSLEKNDPNDEGIHVVTRPNGDGTIGRLEIETTNMPLDTKKSFVELLDEGTITFAEDSPITDPELLSLIKTNYIPAGTYPIRLENNNFVIIISE